MWKPCTVRIFAVTCYHDIIYIILSNGTSKSHVKFPRSNSDRKGEVFFKLYICGYGKITNHKSIFKLSLTSPWLTSDPHGLHLQWDHRSALWNCKIHVQKWSIQINSSHATITTLVIIQADGTEQFVQCPTCLSTSTQRIRCWYNTWMALPFNCQALPKTLGFTADYKHYGIILDSLCHRDITYIILGGISWPFLTRVPVALTCSLWSKKPKQRKDRTWKTPSWCWPLLMISDIKWQKKDGTCAWH